MKFSTRTLYGLKAVLVLAARYGERSLAVSQIAKKEKLSVAYLEQILHGLKKKGLVKSARGPQGGYVLAKNPADITLKTLLYTLEGGDLAEQNGRLNGDADEVMIGNHLFWKKVQVSMDKGLAELTLKQLLDEARRARRSKGSSPGYNFHI